MDKNLGPEANTLESDTSESDPGMEYDECPRWRWPTKNDGDDTDEATKDGHDTDEAINNNTEHDNAEAEVSGPPENIKTFEMGNIEEGVVPGQIVHQERVVSKKGHFWR